VSGAAAAAAAVLFLLNVHVPHASDSRLLPAVVHTGWLLLLLTASAYCAFDMPTAACIWLSFIV
jgi:hypothetical protein